MNQVIIDNIDLFDMIDKILSADEQMGDLNNNEDHVTILK